MKMHSYTSTNGYLKLVYDERVELDAQLHAVVDGVDGWDQALADAKSARAEREADSSSSSSSLSPSGLSVNAEGYQGYIDPTTAAALSSRIVARALRSNETNSDSGDEKSRVNTPDGKKAPAHEEERECGHERGPTPHPLVDHPDRQVAGLATLYTDLDAELVSSGPERVRWPDNVTFKNFAMYQLIPTLVYELEYPRTKRCVLSSVPPCLPYLPPLLTMRCQDSSAICL